MLPGAHYGDPEFSWKYVVAPGGIGFLSAGAWAAYEGDLFVGAARDTLGRSPVPLPPDRRPPHDRRGRPAARGPRGRQPAQVRLTESESLVFGRDFGIVTDIQTGPNGNLYVVSLYNGAVYEIYRR